MIKEIQNMKMGELYLNTTNTCVFRYLGALRGKCIYSTNIYIDVGKLFDYIGFEEREIIIQDKLILWKAQNL